MVSDTQELPETGEIVIATVTKISDHGAYVTLDEYNKIQGFLHVSEIAPGWVCLLYTSASPRDRG